MSWLRRVSWQNNARYAIFALVAFVTLFLLRIVSDKSTAKDAVRRIVRQNHSRWIVVTTIHEPTAQLKAMNQLAGWKLVVVGDKKTPKNWNLPGCVYLDVDAQTALNYRLSRLLPYNSYARKSIGYLYAIENGAQWIYETDDDNGGDLSAFWLSTRPVYVLRPTETRHLFNPYPHFGQSTMWPRGYPLDQLGKPQSRHYHLSLVNHPAVQQGLADGDPDVDAFFRLTRRPAPPVELRFDSAAPSVALPAGTMAPYNSQDTLHSARAFWALLLPGTVTDRVTDIYRAYWAQRLLWLVDGSLVFHPPNVWHERNIHSPLKDAVQEEAMTRDAGKLVKALATWTCQHDEMFRCIAGLTRYLVDGKFLQQFDVELVDAWIADLKKIGYVPPAISVNKKTLHDGTAVKFQPREQLTSFPHFANPTRVESDIAPRLVLDRYLDKLCPGITSLNTPLEDKPSNILLVVTIGSHADTVIPVAELMYRRHFVHILYCGTSDASSINGVLSDWRVSYVRIPSADAVLCMVHAVQMNYKVSGILRVSYLLAISPGQLPLKSKEYFWQTDTTAVKTLCAQRPTLCQSIVTEDLKRVKIGENVNINKIRSCIDDKVFSAKNETNKIVRNLYTPFYVPRGLTELFRKLVEFYSSSSPTTSNTDFLVLISMECMEHDTIQWLLVESQSRRNNASWLDLNEVSSATAARKTFCKRIGETPSSSKI